MSLLPTGKILAELPENFDLNTFIDKLREERIRNQMAL